MITEEKTDGERERVEQVISGSIFTDTSYYQVPINDTYPWPIASVRAADGTFIDPVYARNLAWCRRACDSGRLAFFLVYVVFRPGSVDATVAGVKAATGRPHRGLVVMIDIESWGGQIRGDHSDEINRMRGQFAAWLGDERRVADYGNAGDLDAIYPRRPAGRTVVASYGHQRPSIEHVAWQYSDGQDRWSVPDGAPRSSLPFGRCDHNIFPDRTPVQAAAIFGVAPAGFAGHASITESNGVEDMTGLSEQAKKEIAEIVAIEVHKQLIGFGPRLIGLLRWGKGNKWFGPGNAGALLDNKGLDGLLKERPS